jgi:hypothetical protein
MTRTNKPLQMFVTGPAGAGKCKQQYYSVLLITIVSMMLTNPFSSQIIGTAKLFSQNISHLCRRAIRVTAMTGAAAMEIGGVTTASEFHYIQNKAMLRKTD